MSFPTWGELLDSYCACKGDNPHYEDFANRRYNPSPRSDAKSCRLVFLKGVLDTPGNNTLRRKGRFIWCKNFRYEGRNTDGFRQVSFTVDQGHKRFTVAENNVLCIPAKTYVHNNRFFRSKLKTFKPFSSVFAYQPALKIMSSNSGYTHEEFVQLIKQENPFRPGTLVLPRLGYFYPERDVSPSATKQPLIEPHPCGIILGPAFVDEYLGREFYRVRFGDTTYERVHPVQLEILNEV